MHPHHFTSPSSRLQLVVSLPSSLPPSPHSTDGGRHRQAGHPGVHRPGGQLRLPRSDERTGAAPRYRDEGIIIIYLRSTMQQCTLNQVVTEDDDDDYLSM